MSDDVLREFLAALADSEPRPVRNSTRYPQSVLQHATPAPRGAVVTMERTPTGFERGRVRERKPEKQIALCASCFERTERTQSGREFCVPCATEARVVYVEPEYSDPSVRRMEAKLPNGKRKFMF